MVATARIETPYVSATPGLIKPTIALFDGKSLLWNWISRVLLPVTSCARVLSIVAPKVGEEAAASWLPYMPIEYVFAV